MRNLNHKLKLIRQLADNIGVPANNVDRYCLKEYIKQLEELKTEYRNRGAFGDAHRVNTIIAQYEGRLLV